MGDDNSNAGGAKPTVFVSYSRGDQKRVLPLIDLIRMSGYEVWWDGMLEGGERFSRTTETVLESARAVVVFWSETSIASHWVHDEATTGRDHNCLVPLSLDGSPPPLGFRQFQTIDISRAKIRPGDPAIRNILHAIAALHDQAPEPAAPPAGGRMRLDRRVMLAGGGLLVVAGGLGAAWRAGLFAPGSQDSSVAVLPFENMSGDPNQRYFADGLASEVRSELARNALLQVVGQASSNAVRAMKGDAQAIARKLGVAFLVDGNVRRSGDKVRVSAELIDGASGINRWTETFERPLADVFAVQSEIARAVARAITSRVGTQESRENNRKAGGTASIAAYDAFLRARDITYTSGVGSEAQRAAIAQLDQAIAADPGYGKARVIRSLVLRILAGQSAKGAERMELLRESLAEARRAVDVAPEYGGAFAALGNAIFGVQLDAKSARAPFDRARLLGAGEPEVLSDFASFCGFTGRFAEARAAANQAITLDPLNPFIANTKSVIEYMAGDCGAAIAAGERALQLNPNLGYANGIIGNCQLRQGDITAAKASFAAMPPEFQAMGLAMVAHREGKEVEAQAYFRETVAQRGDASAYRQAQMLAQWGQHDKALDALDLAFRVRDSNLIQLGQDHLLDPLRDMPRFRAMKQRMGFD